MKTFLIAFAAVSIASLSSAAFADDNQQPAPLTPSAPAAAEAPATPAPAPMATANAPAAEHGAKSEATKTEPAKDTAPVRSDEKAKKSHRRDAAEAERPVKRQGERRARYSGGEGSTWKMGRDTYGFQGTYGGCTYRGHAGPNGYVIDSNC